MVRDFNVGELPPMTDLSATGGPLNARTAAYGSSV